MEESKQQTQKCNRCKVNYTMNNFDQKRNGDFLKSCKRCRERVNEWVKCTHNKNRYTCRDCNGSGICKHNKIRNKCRDCGGSQICQHNKIRSRCRDCGGSEFCQHNRRRENCKDCCGSQICKHQKHKYYCKECNEPIHITITRMMNGAKANDKKSNLYDQLNFIDYCFVENLIDDCGDKCYYCECQLQYLEFNGNLATIERIDNSKGHIKGNCVIACKNCNTTNAGHK